MSKKYNEKGEELFKAGRTYITKEEAVYVQAFQLARERDTLKEENKELKEKIERLEGDLKEESTHYCCEKCDGCKKCGDCECDEEEKEELRKRIRELENDSSCKNCGVGKGRVGCGKDCFQDDDKRDT
jgi:transposase-like protein